MIKKIIIATDGSETSQKAARVGIETARLSGGRVTAVYVVDVFRLAHLPGYAAFPGPKDKLMELMQKEGRDATEYVEKQALEVEIPCQKIVAEGDPSEELLRISGEADLLIMGSVGRTGLDKLLLGSVAEKVVRHSTVPVLLIPGGDL